MMTTLVMTTTVKTMMALLLLPPPLLLLLLLLLLMMTMMRRRRGRKMGKRRKNKGMEIGWRGGIVEEGPYYISAKYSSKPVSYWRHNYQEGTPIPYCHRLHRFANSSRYMNRCPMLRWIQGSAYCPARSDLILLQTRVIDTDVKGHWNIGIISSHVKTRLNTMRYCI